MCCDYVHGAKAWWDAVEKRTTRLKALKIRRDSRVPVAIMLVCLCVSTSGCVGMWVLFLLSNLREVPLEDHRYVCNASMLRWPQHLPILPCAALRCAALV